MLKGPKADDPCPTITIRLSPIAGLEVDVRMPPEQAFFVLNLVAQQVMAKALMPPPPNGAGIVLPPGMPTPGSALGG